MPQLDELRLHNGTVYRWNRPVYDISDGKPHLRVENRVLPAGPTVVDTMANAAFFAGLVRALADEDRPIWTQMSFQAAQRELRGRHPARHQRRGLLAAGRAGARSPSSWSASCLPMAAEGLRQWEVDEVEIGRLLDIIERRCLRTANGATWQTAEVARREAGWRIEAGGVARDARQLSAALMHSNEPVHTWEVN